MGTERQEFALGVIGQFAFQRDCAAVIVGEEILRTGRQPFHRTLELFRQQHQHRIFRKRRGARAESAADIEHAHTDFVMRDARHDRQFMREGGAALIGL